MKKFILNIIYLALSIILFLEPSLFAMEPNASNTTDIPHSFFFPIHASQQTASAQAASPIPTSDFQDQVSTLFQKIVKASFISDAAFRSALANLHEQPEALRDEMAQFVANEYSKLQFTQFNERWYLVWLLSQMTLIQQSQALETFRSVLKQPSPLIQPSLQSQQIENLEPHQSSLDEKEIYEKENEVKLAAIEGLWRLASLGKSNAAQRVLRKQIQHSDYAVRSMAVASYMQLSGQDKAAVKKEVLSSVKKPGEKTLVELQWLSQPPIWDPTTVTSIKEPPAATSMPTPRMQQAPRVRKEGSGP